MTTAEITKRLHNEYNLLIKLGHSSDAAQIIAARRWMSRTKRSHEALETILHDYAVSRRNDPIRNTAGCL